MKIINKLLYKLHIKKPPRLGFVPTGTLPDPIKEILQNEGLNTESVIFSFKTDMTGAETFGDCFIFFDEKGVYTAEFEETPLPKKKKRALPLPSPLFAK